MKKHLSTAGLTSEDIQLLTRTGRLMRCDGFTQGYRDFLDASGGMDNITPEQIISFMDDWEAKSDAS